VYLHITGGKWTVQSVEYTVDSTVDGFFCASTDVSVSLRSFLKSCSFETSSSIDGDNFRSRISQTVFGVGPVGLKYRTRPAECLLCSVDRKKGHVIVPHREQVNLCERQTSGASLVTWAACSRTVWIATAQNINTLSDGISKYFQHLQFYSRANPANVPWSAWCLGGICLSLSYPYQKYSAVLWIFRLISLKWPN